MEGKSAILAALRRAKCLSTRDIWQSSEAVAAKLSPQMVRRRLKALEQSGEVYVAITCGAPSRFRNSHRVWKIRKPGQVNVDSISSENAGWGDKHRERGQRQKILRESKSDQAHSEE